MPDNDTPVVPDDSVEPEETETEPNGDSESDEESDGERNKKELLTSTTLLALMDGDPLQTAALSIFRQIESNVETGKNAAQQNTDSYAAALKEYADGNPEEHSAWIKRNDELTSALDALKQKISEHRTSLENSVEPFRKVADVDLGNVNERHRTMKRSLFGFLTAAGVSDVDNTYRVPELPVSVKVSTGWAPRLSRITLDGKEISFPGKYPTLTDLNKALDIKGEQGQGATWANLFGTREVPASGLSTTRTINGKSFRIVITPR